MKGLMTEREVSEYTGIKVKTLQSHRLQKRGLPYYKIEKMVRYKLSEVKAWLKRNKVDH